MATFGFFVKRLIRPQIIHLRPTFSTFFYREFFSSQPFLTQKDATFNQLNATDISPKGDDPISGRKWLPGSQGKGFPKFLAKPRQDFPHALQLKTSDQQYRSKELADICKSIIDNDLTKYGAILFRDLPLAKAEDFADFSVSMGYESMDYKGGSANRRLVNKNANVYTANDDPSAYTIELHNELAYAPVYPRKLLFFCLEQPNEGCGGHTLLCDGKKIMAKLNPKLLQKLEDKHVRYWYRVPHENNTSYRSWQDMFDTSDKKEVESFLEKEGFNFSWGSKDDSLQFWITRPPFINHPDTGEKLWFNHLHRKHLSTLIESPMFPVDEDIDSVYRHTSFYGDGSEVEEEVLQYIRAVAWECTVGFQWQTGDLLVVDNFLVLHGRLGFKRNRKILANLLAN